MQLGIQLSLTPAKLREIELNNPDVETRKIRMFTLWLKLIPTASWEDLISALKIIGENEIARDLEHKYTDKDKKANAGGNVNDM